MRKATIGNLCLVLLWLSSAAALADCDAKAVCEDVTDSLSGQINVEAITISWSSDAEGSDIDYYRVVRYDCNEPNLCTDEVEIVAAVGVCSQSMPYVVIDTPPAPVSSWTYSVEVWNTSSQRVCAIDVSPQ